MTGAWKSVRANEMIHLMNICQTGSDYVGCSKRHMLQEAADAQREGRVTGVGDFNAELFIEGMTQLQKAEEKARESRDCFLSSAWGRIAKIRAKFQKGDG
jgi:hypothetical protein